MRRSAFGVLAIVTLVARRVMDGPRRAADEFVDARDEAAFRERSIVRAAATDMLSRVAWLRTVYPPTSPT